MNASVRYLSPAEAAARLGVSAKALRLYEDRGLISPGRNASGWRAYGPDDLDRIAEIVALRRLGFSLAQVHRILGGSAEGLDAPLAALQLRLEADLDQARERLDRVRLLRRDLATGRAPAVRDLAVLAPGTAKPVAAFDLPWPWGGERFELRDPGAITYIVGPLGSGKTRLAKALAEHVEGGIFLGLERTSPEALAAVRSALDSDPGLRERADMALAWLIEDGASPSEALFALVSALEVHADHSLVIDMVEEDLDEPSQAALVAHLRRRGPEAPPLFLMTRSSSILDLTATVPGETALFCPANHSPPVVVRLVPGAPGYEALASCLGPLELRARTAGMTVSMSG